MPVALLAVGGIGADPAASRPDGLRQEAGASDTFVTYVRGETRTPSLHSGCVPLFYFHVCNGNGFTEDEDGLDLPSVPAARAVAINALRDLLAGELRSGTLNMASFIEVEDESRQAVMTVSFSDAVAIETKTHCR